MTKAYPNSWFINEKGQEIRSDRRKEYKEKDREDGGRMVKR
jgi:hypothetical protein